MLLRTKTIAICLIHLSVEVNRFTFPNKLKETKKNPGKIWEVLNEAVGRKKPKNKISEINSSKGHLSKNIEIAEEFNSFFADVGEKISKNIKNTSITPESFLTPNPDLPSIEFDAVGPILICDILKTFDSKKSKDMDGISMDLLKFLNTSISVPLAHIFNLSLSKGIFPSKLKCSRVVPVFKSGEHLNCDNYRPISLVSAISKILEKIVALKLTNFLDINKLLYNFQFGFQKGLSTEHNLLHLTNFVSHALNDDKYCIGIFLDLKKAFDLVSHDILLKKLKNLGVNDIALKWFESYLGNRSQCVDINGVISLPRFIRMSVMQGSILGPLLFLCFINDLHLSTNLMTLLFADDTCALASNKNLDELILTCNNELQKLGAWFCANKLSINIKKCKYIIFHKKGKKIDINTPNLVFNLNEPGLPVNEADIIPLDRISTLSSEKTYKYLGILIDEHLNFNPHVDYICSKLSKGLFCLRRGKSFLNKKSLLTLYYSIFHSHLLYCPSIYSCSSKTQLNRIFKLQKKALRTITNSGYNDHTGPLFKELKILPLHNIIYESKMLFMHSIYYEQSPPSFRNVWRRNITRNLSQNLRNEDDFYLPPPKFEAFKNYPPYSFPKTWNEAGDLRFYANKFTFKQALRYHLLMADEMQAPN